MYSPLIGSNSASVPHFDSQSVEHSTDDIPLRLTAAKGQAQESASYQGYVDQNADFNGNPLVQPIHHPVSRPRRAPTSVFWHNPWSVATLIFVGDLILTFLPCLFLILSFQALKVDHQPISSHGKTVEQAAKLGPTLFPIIFAAVVGRLMRTFALWRAERGATLGILEQLNGSQNLLAAFERAVMLPGLGLLSFGVVLLWALSPLGGQSALRVLGRGTHSTPGNATLYYFNNTGDADNGAFSGASAYSTYSGSLNAAFQAALTSIQIVNGSDIWGNIKIPVLQYMDNYKAGQNTNGWYDFNDSNYTEPYSALTGTVVSGLQSGLDTNFTMETSYFNLTCPDPVFFNTSDDNSDSYGGFADWVLKEPLVQRGTNRSLLFSGLAESNGLQTFDSYMIDSQYNHTPKSDPLPIFNIIYASMGNGDGMVSAYNCSMGLSHIEADILCNSSDCHVRRVRPSQNFTPPTSGWPFPTASITPPYNLLHWLGSATSLQRTGISPIDHYVAGSDTPFLLSDDISFTNVSGEYFAKRLQSIVNTGWQLSYQNAATAQKPPTNITALRLSTNASTASVFTGGVGYPVRTALATTINKQEVFVANLAWVTVTVIVSFILLFCGIASMIFKYGSHSPDILGYVSSLTRDNPNFEQIPGGDKLDGIARARVMRHVRVQIVDVRPWDENGHVMLKSIGYRGT